MQQFGHSAYAELHGGNSKSELKVGFYFSGAARISVRGRVFSGVGLVGGPRAEPRGCQKILKICKEILKKTAKMDYFRRFSKELKKHFVKFSRFRRKTQLFGNF